MLQNILVVGGNGFIGSAVCKAALAQGMHVTSISSSGRPFKTPGGHSPAWASKVNWLAADVFQSGSYERILTDKTAVVHTLGTLLEDTSYKGAIKEGDIAALTGSLFRGITGVRIGGANPLASKGFGKTYERLNRDSALQVCKSFLSHSQPTSHPVQRKSFVYISAEDIFRPFIPARYITTKREAEQGIASILRERTDIKGVFIRPSLVYHAHYRPLTTPFATALDFSSTVHRNAPTGLPTPSTILRSLDSMVAQRGSEVGSTPLRSIANALTIPPIHVDHVAEAVCKAIADDNVDGVVDVARMRDIIGWSLKSNSATHVEHSSISSS